MKKHLTILSLSLAAACLFGGGAVAGDHGYGYRVRVHSHGCADSKFQTPRINQLMPFRHFEDRRRYNAAPCCGEIVYAEPYIVKTVIVRKAYVPHYYYDSHGHRHCHKVYTVTYKDIYSDGSCYVYYRNA